MNCNKWFDGMYLMQWPGPISGTVQKYMALIYILQGAGSSRAVGQGDTAADLGNEVFHDVGRAVIGHILAVDSDNVCECLRVML